MNVQMNSGVGNLWRLLRLLKNLAIVAGWRMFCNVFSHAQPAVVFLKFLHLISDGHIKMALPEVANDRLSVLEGQVQRFERGDIRTASRTVDPNCSMMVDKQVAVEVFEFQLVVWV